MTDSTETTATPATSERRARTRARLIAAAFDVFAEHGFTGASLEMICERAGLTRGAFYYNFASKEELFLAVMDREFENSMSGLAAAAMSPQGDLFGLVSVLNSSLVRDQIAWAILTEEFRLHAMRDPETARAYTERFENIYERLGLALEQAAAAYGLRMLAPAETIAAIVAGIFLQTVSEGVLARRSTEEIQQIAADRVMVTLQGLMPAATA